jgi:hypothetical protein
VGHQSRADAEIVVLGIDADRGNLGGTIAQKSAPKDGRHIQDQRGQNAAGPIDPDHDVFGRVITNISGPTGEMALLKSHDLWHVGGPGGAKGYACRIWAPEELRVC